MNQETCVIIKKNVFDIFSSFVLISQYQNFLIFFLKQLISTQNILKSSTTSTIMPCWRRTRLLMLLDQYLENLQETNRLKGRKYKRSVWIRELFRQPGDFDILVNDLRATDREYHFHYTRMSKERFDHLLTLIFPKITKQDTHLRPAKPASEKLYMTLQFLADGRSQIGLIP